MYRNVAGQEAVIYAYDVSADAPKTGDAANITGMIRKDHAAATGTSDLHPSEIGGGLYAFELTQSETDCSLFVLFAASTTSGVKIDPVIDNTLRYATSEDYSGTYACNLEVNFGPAYSGLTGTVQYQLIDRRDGSTLLDWTSTGVAESIAGTGVYDVTADLNTTWRPRVRWRTAEDGVYMSEDIAGDPPVIVTQTIVLTPVSSLGNSGLIDDTNLTAYRNACFSFTLLVTDANGDAVNLSGKLVAFVAYPPGKTRTIKIELTTDGEAGDRVVVGGDGGNQVTIEGSDAHTATQRTLRWCLRNQDDDVVLLRGVFTIEDEGDQAVIE